MSGRNPDTFDLKCGRCAGIFRAGAGSATCHACGESYLDDDGIVVMARGFDSPQKESQARFFDSALDPEWEIERPRGAAPFHQWLLREKLRRGTRGIPLAGKTILAVCAGSGMDAELLIEAGAQHVVAVDASHGAARRTKERARRRLLPVTAVVADAEQLPFPPQSFDISFVHDGLHHLGDPRVALREMARVARVAVCVTEPARAALTAGAVRLGLAESREEAGNEVVRFAPQEIAAELRDCGFRTVTQQRYAMYYRHRPGVVSDVLSWPPLLHLATRGLRVGNAVAGRIGNKLAVTAVREVRS